MDTKDIYEKYLFDKFLHQVLSCRDRWRSGTWIQREGHSDDLLSLCSIAPQGESLYSFIMNEAHKALREALISVAFSLAKHLRNAPVLSFRTLTSRSCEEYYASLVNQDPLYVCSRVLEDNQPIPMLGLGSPDDISLFLFRENELLGVLPDEVHRLLLSQPGISRITYVTFSDIGARSAILNAESLENSRIKGFRVYSYQEFITEEFGKGEREKLSLVLERAKEAAYYYCGLSVVKAVRQSSLRFFKSDIEYDLLARIDSMGLPDNERGLMDERFIKGRAYRALTGSGDFAKSYMTAEWLYLSLKSACRSPLGNSSIVDLTPIVSSHFKAIEQFLYAFISLHTKEREGVVNARKLFIHSRWQVLDPSQQYRESVDAIRLDHKGFADITDELMSPAFKEKLSLKTLIGFFGGRRLNGTYRENRNIDLFVFDANDSDTYHKLIDVLEKVKDRRNGFFHKDNLYDWSVVDEVRGLVTLAFLFLLGSTIINAEEEAELGFSRARTLEDDFLMLCDYVYEAGAHEADRSIPEDGIVRLPVYYINDSPVAYIAVSDRDVAFNADGIPLHSGIFLRILGSKTQYDVKIDRRNLPSLLLKGYLEIECDGSHFELNLTEQKMVIFKDGKFCDPADVAL